jgi:AAA domain
MAAPRELDAIVNENPYVGYGTVAIGQRFVGRSEQLERLMERVLTGAGSTAIVGLARIGKSSLAAELLRRTADAERKSRPTLVLDLSTFENGAAVLAYWHHWLGQSDGSSSASIHQNFRLLRRYLETVGPASRQIVVVDELDAVRQFPDGADFLRLLRELLHDPSRTGVVAILCSRRPIAALEQQMQDISTLAGVMEHLSIGPFDEEEFKVLCSRASSRVGAGWREAVWRVSGGHPFLAEMGLCASLRGDGSVEVDEFHDQALRYFQQLEVSLNGEGLLLELIQEVIGPRVSSNRAAFAELQRYGLMRSPRQALSQAFTEFLELVALNLDLWGLFGEVERELRRVIDTVLTDAYGVNYLDIVSKRNKGIATSLAEAERLREVDTRKFPSAHEQNLLHYTYPMQLQGIMQAEWKLFKPIMMHDLTYWRPRLELLARVRAPYAHSREEVVPETDVRLADIYCREILKVINKWSAASENQVHSSPPT